MDYSTCFTFLHRFLAEAETSPDAGPNHADGSDQCLENTNQGSLGMFEDELYQLTSF